MKSGVGLWKRRAAEVAAELVKNGMVTGLGSGSTMAEVVRCLARKKPKAIFIPASSMIERTARRLGLKLGTLDAFDKLDLMLDGADEVDPNLNLIKGRGGAHTREKILTRSAERVVIVVDKTKLVRRLGKRSPVPVEVLPFAVKHAEKKLAKKLGGRPKLRVSGSRPYITDNRNYILDVKFHRISKPANLEREVNRIPGVVENGIFVGLADAIIVGHEKGVKTINSKRDFLQFVRQKFKACG
jgi:ribose 5-phosphate isomerase A